MGLNTIWAGKFVKKRKKVLFTALDKGVGSADLAIREINIQIQIRIKNLIQTQSVRFRFIFRG